MSVSDRNDPALIAAAQAGDVAARNQLIVANLGLIYQAIAYVVGPRGMVERDNYLGVAVEGFIRALRLFDRSKGMLSTYATHVVRQKVRREWNRRRWTITVPELDAKTSPSRTAAAVKAMKCKSLDLPRGFKRSDGGTWSLMDGLRGLAGDGEDDRGERVALLLGALASLDERERVVVVMRAEGKTLAAVGAAIGVSKERARQIGDAATVKMRAFVDEAVEGPCVRERSARTPEVKRPARARAEQADAKGGRR